MIEKKAGAIEIKYGYYIRVSESAECYNFHGTSLTVGLIGKYKNGNIRFFKALKRFKFSGLTHHSFNEAYMNALKFIDEDMSK